MCDILVLAPPRSQEGHQVQREGCRSQNCQKIRKLYHSPSIWFALVGWKGTGWVGLCGCFVCQRKLGKGCCRWKGRRLVKTLEFKFNFFAAFFTQLVQRLWKQASNMHCIKTDEHFVQTKLCLSFWKSSPSSSPWVWHFIRVFQVTLGNPSKVWAATAATHPSIDHTPASSILLCQTIPSNTSDISLK